MYIVSVKEVGPPHTPQEIKRLRRQNMDVCRKMGQPVVFKHMWTEFDVDAGDAKRCPACYDSAYDQPRNDCPVCFGFTFVSTEDTVNPDLYINTSGLIVETGSPGLTWPRAPRWGGFSQSVLTWLMEPDVAVDVFRISDQGTLLRTLEATGVAPWFPQLSDNDLCINVELSVNDYAIVSTGDRFQLKMVQPITVRGFGKRGRPPGSGGQAYKVAQSFQMAKFPNNSSLYDVPVDVA